MLRDVVLPYLRELGARWERGEATVAQEHFASNLLRGRLLGLARGWGRGSGPTAVLACAPGELHDLPLIGFGLVLSARGLDDHLPRPGHADRHDPGSSAGVEPRLVVITAVTWQRFHAAQAQLTELARDVPVALAGSGATAALARATGAVVLEGDPVAAAERIAEDRR